MFLLQVTITTTNTPQLITPAQAENGLGNGIYFQSVIFQNNGVADMRIGDSSVSSTKGIKLTAGGSLTSSLPLAYSGNLNEWWVNGTSGDKLDILVIT